MNQINQQLIASKISDLASTTNEKALEKEISNFFKRIRKEVLNALEEYWNDNSMFQGQIDLILAPIHTSLKEYYEIILARKVQEYQRGSKAASRIVKRITDNVAMKSAKPVTFTPTKDNLFGTLSQAENRLSNYTFTASESTMNRVDQNIKEILTTGYTDGVGINEVANRVSERFGQLESWESKRIARTEIHNAQNIGIMDTYENLGVEYTMWSAAGDDRTRDSHVELDGEIIPMGGVYSNGLGYPGDTGGAIEEWVNCRCSNAPFVMPAGMMAPPGASQFREEDLIPLDTQDPQQTTFDQEQFEAIQTNEEISEFFGLEYLPKGREEYSLNLQGEFFEFHDPKTGTYLRFYKDSLNKIEQIDYDNMNKGTVNIKDIIKDYKNTPTHLKEASSTISFLKGSEITVAGSCHQEGNIDIYDPAFKTVKGNKKVSWSSTLWHEMMHAYDFALHEIDIGTGQLKIRENTGGYHRINKMMEKEWAKASQKDKAYQIKKGLMQQETTRYGEDAPSEDIAEMASVIMTKKNKGDKYTVGNAYSIKKPCPERASGCRTPQTVDEIINANPNRAQLMEKWINDAPAKNMQQNKQYFEKSIQKFLKEELKYKKEHNLI